MSGGFTNMMREQEDRRLTQQRMIGFVVNNDDSNHPDGKKLQRVQIRYPGINDDTADADLAWHTPGNLDAFSGGSDVGSHGPIPPVGAKVYGRFEDDTQYHGQYLGGVAHVDNQIAEFVKPQTGDTNTPTNGPSTTSGDNTGSTTGDTATVLNPADSGEYDFTKNYPHTHGGVNASGDLHAHDAVTDYTEHTAVSGTGFARDGKGNVQYTVNGNATRSDNPNAGQGSNIPEGFNAAVYGNGVIYISKDKTISIGGNATINAQGNASITAQGTAQVASQGDATVSSKGKAVVTGDAGASLNSKALVEINSTTAIHINAPIILSQVDIVPGSSGSPAASLDAPTVEAKTAPTPRKRPAATAPTNDTSY